MQPERIQDLEVLLGHSFRVKNYLVNALSHSSIKNEERPSNERLEFLGDSVLGLIVSDALYRRFPTSDEGTLTRIKSQAVSRATLQRVATAMGLDRFILVGKGVAKREIPGSLLGNLFEAIVGAIYLDSGLAASRKFILRHLDVVINEIVEDRAEKNYKSLLQHHCQRELGAVPTYRVLREAGPAHSRAFDVAVVVGGKEFGRARAQAKKEAEQGAARAAMIHLNAVDENPNKAVRGAGVILRIGPEKREQRRKSGGRGERGGRAAAERKSEAAKTEARGAAARSAAARGAETRGAEARSAEAKAGEAGPPHTPGAEKTSSRRSSSRRRRAKAAKDKKAEQEAGRAGEPRKGSDAPAPAAPAAETRSGAAASGSEQGRKKTTRKAKRTRKKASAGGAADKDAAAAPPAEKTGTADEGPAKKKTRRRSRRKKKTGGSGDG